MPYDDTDLNPNDVIFRDNTALTTYIERIVSLTGGTIPRPVFPNGYAGYIGVEFAPGSPVVTTGGGDVNQSAWTNFYTRESPDPVTVATDNSYVNFDPSGLTVLHQQGWYAFAYQVNLVGTLVQPLEIDFAAPVQVDRFYIPAGFTDLHILHTGMGYIQDDQTLSLDIISSGDFTFNYAALAVTPMFALA